MLHLPGGAGETGRWCALGGLERPRDPTSARRPPPPRGGGGGAGGGAFTFIAPRRLSCEPLTRARVRLLGPCSKTGRVGGRHRRRPRALASLRGVAPCKTPRARRRDFARGALRTVRPAPPRAPSPGAGGVGERSRRGRGGPAPPKDTGAPPRGWNPPSPPSRGGKKEGSPRGGERREGGERGDGSGSLGPGIRRALLPGGCNTRGGWAPGAAPDPPRARARAPLPPEERERHTHTHTERRGDGGAGPPRATFPAGPSQPSRSRSRRTAAVEMRPAAAGRRPGGGPPPTPPPVPPAPPRTRRSPPLPPAPPPEGERGEERDGGTAGEEGRVEGSGGTGRGKDPPGPPARPDHAAGLNPPGGLRGPHPFTS